MMEVGQVIDRDHLATDASRENVERLARWLKLTVDPTWDRQKLARMVFWEITPPPPPRMY
jgi:hypothetical protein